ncbi:hypothetical protein JX266_010929 [Neoarthrinium moseri]|nr:hypothetical protein JX266_010929 [Neoarthrinium moseri]
MGDMMSVKTQQSFAFVSVNDSGRPKPADRKLIRKHVMQGKNRRIGVRPVPSDISLSSLAAGGAERATFFLGLPSNQHVSVRPNIPKKFYAQEDDEQEEPETRHPAEAHHTIPPPCPPDLSLVRLAGEVDRYSQKLIFKYMNAARDSMYPVELCVDFDLSRSLWFQWVFSDLAYLYCVLFGASAMEDYMMNESSSSLTLSHLRSTIKNLNANLSDTVLSQCDSTVAVIITLAMVAGMFDDQASALAHVAGLKRIVQLRGGLDGFRHNAKLHIKIGRVDLAYSLTTGENPLFFNSPISLNPIFDTTGVSNGAPEYSPTAVGIRDQRLANVFQDLQYYSRVMNEASMTKHKRREAEFQSVICSIQYRLIQLQGAMENILDECLRLAMLAFLSTTFQVSGKSFQYPYLAKRFCECCLAIEAARQPARDLMLWLLTVGAIALYGTNELWLQQRWIDDVPEIDWGEARRRLKNVIWLDAFHDKPGQRVFETMSCFKRQKNPPEAPANVATDKLHVKRSM